MITERTQTVRQLFPWVGSKWRMMPRLIPLMPHHKRYVSLFGGSAADILRKPRSKEEVYNDLDKDVANVFAVLQEATKRKQLSYRLEYTPYSRLQFSHCIDVIHSSESDAVKRAWAFMVCAIFGFTGRAPSLSRAGGFAVNLHLPSSQRWKYISANVEYVARRFRSILVENRPWQDVLERHEGPDTFVYADPPYVSSTRVNKKMYTSEFSNDDHLDLLKALNRTQAKVMLSGYPHPLYDELLGNWKRYEFDVQCTISPKRRKPRRTEVVWCNYDGYGRYSSTLGA